MYIDAPVIRIKDAANYLDTSLLKGANVWIAKMKVAEIALDKSSQGLDRQCQRTKRHR